VREREMKHLNILKSQQSIIFQRKRKIERDENKIKNISIKIMKSDSFTCCCCLAFYKNSFQLYRLKRSATAKNHAFSCRTQKEYKQHDDNRVILNAWSFCVSGRYFIIIISLFIFLQRGLNFILFAQEEEEEETM
jgi:hypothetical protein